MVVKQITWAASHYLFGSNAGAPVNVQQSGTTPNVALYAGLGPACNDNGAALGSWAIVRALFNGAASAISVNNDAPTTGNAGTDGLNGFSIAAFQDGSGKANIEVSRTLVYDTSSGAYPGAAAIYTALSSLY